jgi:VWFA-related protein
MNHCRILCLLIGYLVLTVYPFTSCAQETTDETITIDSRIVSIEVLVINKHTGERIDGLRLENFQVTDDGRPRTLTFFSQGGGAKQPLALVLITDLNLQSLSDLQMLRLRAALRRAMWESLQIDDQVAVITLFPNFTILRALGQSRQSVLESLTPGARRLEAEVEQTKTRSGDITSGLLAAVHHIQERRQPFRIELVVVGEKSYEALEQTPRSSIEQLLASGAVINRITPSKNQDDVLSYICEQTGGEVVHIRGTDYSDALERVIKNVAQRYSMGFVPDNTVVDGSFHKLSVTVRIAAGNHRPLEVRARQGYYLAPPTGAIKRDSSGEFTLTCPIGSQNAFAGQFFSVSVASRKSCGRMAQSQVGKGSESDSNIGGRNLNRFRSP